MGSQTFLYRDPFSFAIDLLFTRYNFWISGPTHVDRFRNHRFIKFNLLLLEMKFVLSRLGFQKFREVSSLSSKNLRFLGTK